MIIMLLMLMKKTITTTMVMMIMIMTTTTMTKPTVTNLTMIPDTSCYGDNEMSVLIKVMTR